VNEQSIFLRFLNGWLCSFIVAVLVRRDLVWFFFWFFLLCFDEVLREVACVCAWLGVVG